MDKYVLICVLLLLLVEVLCVVCLFSADWLVSDTVGSIRHGLSLFCQASPGEEELCVFQHLHIAWSASSLIVVVAVGVIAISISLFAVNLKRNISSFAAAGKWCALIGIMLLCVVGVIFPLGFLEVEFGGTPYLLVPTFRVGYSYILFNLSIFIAIVALCISNRLFIPHLPQFLRTGR